MAPPQYTVGLSAWQVADLETEVKGTVNAISTCADKSQVLSGDGKCVSPIVKCKAFSELKLEVAGGSIQGSLKVRLAALSTFLQKAGDVAHSLLKRKQVPAQELSVIGWLSAFKGNAAVPSVPCRNLWLVR